VSDESLERESLGQILAANCLAVVHPLTKFAPTSEAGYQRVSKLDFIQILHV